MRLIKSLCFAGFASLVAAGSLSSQIIPFVDDFEGAADGAWTAIQRDNATITTGTLPIVEIGGSDTLGLWGTPTAGNSEARAFLDNSSAFSGFIQIDVDFYYNSGATGDGLVGLSQAGGASATANAFGTFNGYAIINPDTNTLSARNGGSTTDTLSTELAAETWYSLSLVVDTASQTYDVSLDGNLLGNDLGFRSTNPAQELFLMIQTDVGETDQVQGVYFDNYSVTQVPEPSTIALIMGVAGIGVVLYRRRRR